MDYLYLSLVVICVSATQITQKAYNGKEGRGGFCFSAMSVLCAAIFFLCISAGKLEFRADVLLYSLFFALGYGTAVITASAKSGGRDSSCGAWATLVKSSARVDSSVAVHTRSPTCCSKPGISCR